MGLSHVLFNVGTQRVSVIFLLHLLLTGAAELPSCKEVGATLLCIIPISETVT